MTSPDTGWFDQLQRPIQPPMFSSPSPNTATSPSAPADNSWFDQLQRPIQPPMMQQSAPAAPKATGTMMHNIGAGMTDASAGLMNVIADPFANLIAKPAAVLGGTLYDAGAHAFGYPAMTPEQRADLYGENDPPQPGTRLVEGIGQALGTPPSQVPATTDAQKMARKATAGAGMVASLGPGGVLPIVAGAGGAAAGHELAQAVPEWAAPGTEMATNAGAGMGIYGAGRKLGGPAVSPETAQLADLAQNTYDMPVRAGQISGNRFVRQVDSALQSIPFSGHTGLDEPFYQAVNSALAKSMGQDADKITPAVMRAARSTIGDGLNQIENSATVDLSHPQTISSFVQLAQNARDGLQAPEFDVVKRQINNIINKMDPNGQIPGATYGNLIHQGSPLDQLVNNSNPNIANYGAQIKTILRDSLGRSLSPEDFQKYQDLRMQWKNMRTIEPLTQQASIPGGPSPSTGDIIPWNIRSAVNQSFKNVAFDEPGSNVLNDIADISQRFIKEYHSSGTSERGWLLKALGTIGEVGAAGLGIHGAQSMALPGAGTIAGMAGMAASPILAARAIGAPLRNTNPIGRWNANRMIQSGLSNAPETSAATGAGQVAVPLMTSEGQRQLEPPQTSTNPRTGLPEFSLEANQEQAAATSDPKRQIVNDLVSRLPGGASPDPALASPDGLNAWIGQNKQQLRSQFGGQGIQNIMATAAMLRRSAASPDGTTAFSVHAKSLPEGVQSPADLAAMAMMNPAIAKELAGLANGGRVSRFSQQRLAKLVSSGGPPLAAQAARTPTGQESRQ